MVSSALGNEDPTDFRDVDDDFNRRENTHSHEETHVSSDVT